MNIYLVIITTVLVVTQIIRIIQNAVQLRRQQTLFEKQLGSLSKMDLTETDFETQRKAYRLIVEHFETSKIKHPIISREKRNVINVSASAEVDELIESHEPGTLVRKLQKELGEAVWNYATSETNYNPAAFSYKGKAIVSVLDKAVKDNG